MAGDVPKSGVHTLNCDLWVKQDGRCLTQDFQEVEMDGMAGEGSVAGAGGCGLEFLGGGAAALTDRRKGKKRGRKENAPQPELGGVRYYFTGRTW